MSIDLGREKATAAFSLGDGRSRRTGFRDNDEFVGAIGVYSTGPIIQVAGKRYCAREGMFGLGFPATLVDVAAASRSTTCRHSLGNTRVGGLCERGRSVTCTTANASQCPLQLTFHH